MLLQSTNIQDLTFRTMDMVMIVGGVVSFLGTFLWMKFTMQAQDKELRELEVRLAKAEAQHDTFKEKIFEKLEEYQGSITNIEKLMVELKTEIANLKK